MTEDEAVEETVKERERKGGLPTEEQKREELEQALAEEIALETIREREMLYKRKGWDEFEGR